MFLFFILFLSFRFARPINNLNNARVVEVRADQSSKKLASKPTTPTIVIACVLPSVCVCVCDWESSADECLSVRSEISFIGSSA